MKFVKFLPALATVMIALPTYAKAAPTVTDKTVVYSCNKKTVTAVYQFENQEPTGAMVSIGNKIIAKNFTRDKSQSDFTSFTSGKYVWNVDSGLTLDTFDSVFPVNLVQKGKNSDQIIIKNCDINAEATKKANL